MSLFINFPVLNSIKIIIMKEKIMVQIIVVNGMPGCGKTTFEEYCLKPAIHMRGIIKHQISLIDLEFNNELPDIKIKDSL